ncbi:hypothetical protein GMES_1932 [Paraglaciecola mesophila KMM 241]|uniref:Uncharacterized protein n=1 Tax=Paraglaciecola mesophila KMM 241 TaxID=1128912 RepID=K6Z5E6_9ALTE|nr:hypothetical protein GMES_1932 [Paraglaciecola mesophila KMM 241]
MPAMCASLGCSANKLGAKVKPPLQDIILNRKVFIYAY